MVAGKVSKSNSADGRLEELGVQLPAAPSPFGTYVETLETGRLLFLSGMLPVVDHQPKYVGRLGKELDAEAGRDAAYTAALSALAAAKQHLGSLNRISRVVRPGSIIEQLKIIDPLTDPVAYGGKAEDAFDVVIPSLPGYGFSGKPTEIGWDPKRVAHTWIELMKRLGYPRFVAQGGDWGNAVTELMALEMPPELLGIHTNMPGTVPADIEQALQLRQPPPNALSANERRARDQLDFFYKHGLGYAQEMSGRPQTLYALEDSPIGLAAWILDHDASSQALIARVFDGQTEGLTRDDILENITLYWFTKTAVSSARLYWEYKGGFFDPRNVAIPVAVSAFPDEIYQAPKSWTEKAYPKLIYYNRLPKGGHFAAWEQPELFTAELRAAFRPLR